MNAKGRLAVTGTLGFDVNFIRKFTLPDGSIKYRFVTDQPILFGEAWSSSRSTDYSLSIGEIVISKDKKKIWSTLYPAARFKLDKKKKSCDGDISKSLEARKYYASLISGAV
jgi:hypothetical protein